VLHQRSASNALIGDLPRLNKENIPSRAYIAFRTEEQLAQFGREYDGHLFRDKAGRLVHSKHTIVFRV